MSSQDSVDEALHIAAGARLFRHRETRTEGHAQCVGVCEFHLASESPLSFRSSPPVSRPGLHAAAGPSPQTPPAPSSPAGAPGCCWNPTRTPSPDPPASHLAPWAAPSCWTLQTSPLLPLHPPLHLIRHPWPRTPAGSHRHPDQPRTRWPQVGAGRGWFWGRVPRDTAPHRRGGCSEGHQGEAGSTNYTKVGARFTQWGFHTQEVQVTKGRIS